MKSLERRTLSISVEEADILKSISDETDIKIVDLANAIINLLKDDKKVLAKTIAKASELDKIKREDKRKRILINRALKDKIKGIDPAELEKILSKLK